MPGDGAPSADGSPVLAPAAGRRDLHARAHRGRGGRPRDHGATARVIAATQDLLADRRAAITVDAIATRAGVGKATIYRRWSTASDLIADAVLAVDPLPDPPSPTDDGRTQLTSLLQRLTEPLHLAELTAAAALAHSARDPQLREAAERTVLVPLRERVRAACRAGDTADESAVGTVVSLVEGLWVRRFLLCAPPLASDEVRAVVDDVLLAVAPRCAVHRR
ncbi:transcriptional regulator, TetR family [Klenkia soli]|uniref:Transcriptional regulator, TetR family n=1 Tax=Klenkia soli TaxID=1052260 RepID=A0A1H0P4M4_9ACTN|nr:TetR/AcrR family transcriptional regulator [Klenkia soli]SDP00027.1 transcriptional regulator, TetR family [Klenkia soli]